MMSSSDPGRGGTSAQSEVTALLVRWSEGDAEALQQLMPLVYAECHRIAEAQLWGERAEHTLSPTALVHEIYLRLVDQRRATWKNRAQFFGITAQLMRRTLVDYARAKHARKRDNRLLVSLDAALETPSAPAEQDILALDEALEKLGRHDPDQQRIVELRFFAGLTVEETAHVLERSPRTVKREWQLAKAWLFRELNAGGLQEE